jgi:hypothetical protein
MIGATDCLADLQESLTLRCWRGDFGAVRKWVENEDKKEPLFSQRARDEETL